MSEITSFDDSYFLATRAKFGYFISRQLLSAIFFIGVSLATPPTERIRLAPFFPDVANEVFRGQSLEVNKNSSLYREVMGSINQKTFGDRAHLNLSIDLQVVDAGRRIKIIDLVGSL